MNATERASSGKQRDSENIGNEAANGWYLEDMRVEVRNQVLQLHCTHSQGTRVSSASKISQSNISRSSKQGANDKFQGLMVHEGRSRKDNWRTLVDELRSLRAHRVLVVRVAAHSTRNDATESGAGARERSRRTWKELRPTHPRRHHADTPQRRQTRAEELTSSAAQQRPQTKNTQRLARPGGVDEDLELEQRPLHARVVRRWRLRLHA